MCSGLVGDVFDALHEQGFFYDPVEKEVTDEFMPWLDAEMDKKISNNSLAEETLRSLIEHALTIPDEDRVLAEELRAKAKMESEKSAEAERVCEKTCDRV